MSAKMKRSLDSFVLYMQKHAFPKGKGGASNEL